MPNMTIKDSARISGCSVSTISRVINDRPDVRPETKEHVLQVMRDAGFVPNTNARQLKIQQSRSLAFVVKGTRNIFFSDFLVQLRQNIFSAVLRRIFEMFCAFLCGFGRFSSQFLHKCIIFLNSRSLVIFVQLCYNSDSILSALCGLCERKEFFHHGSSLREHDASAGELCRYSRR